MTWTTIFAIAEVVWIIGAGVWLILEKRSPTATLAWIFGLALLPAVGIVAYLVLGPQRLRRKRRRRRHARTAVQTSAAEKEAATPRPADANLAMLATLAERAGEGALARADEVTLFDNGLDAYRAIEEAILAAKHHVHLEYFIWEGATIGTRLRDLLARRSREGIRVRLLVDGMGSLSLTRKWLQELRSAGAEVEIFNEVGIARFQPRMINFRSHRKIIVVDGQVGFTGGMNIVDYHSSEFAGAKAWRDTHARIRGADAVRGLQLLFCEDWHYTTGDSPKGDEYYPRDTPTGHELVQIVGSGPDSTFYPIHKLYFSAIATARKRVLVTTPYFVPDDPMVHALTTSAMRGVDVRILVPAGSDSKLVSAAARTYFEELMRVGVRIWEYTPSMLHAKTLVVDDEFSMVGTCNMDNRSFRLNFECAAVFYDAKTASQLAAWFERDVTTGGDPVTMREVRPGFVQRLGENAARLFSPIL